ncbi:DUF3034 family protein [Thermomonas sp.]|uniref:DUF3034 family protein n=1 Tax=Thermomonas sp. TaxID=1971895 RepID=UPI00248828E0|nr:DUF3034 family protein [Thermomonas sp.]MDI1252993.1 DUF3034 family protein [Thermomonas sp.]
MKGRRTSLVISLCLFGWAFNAQAQEASALQDQEPPAEPVQTPTGTSGKLLLTGGVTQIEGAAGGGLTPWAVIGGYGTHDQIGANAYYTRVNLSDYNLQSYGALVGIHDRVELSVSRQAFDTEAVGAALGLGHGFTIRQDTYGLKVKIAGDAVLEQDNWMPQVAVGVQYKHNDQGGLLSAIGAKSANGTDVYVSATKLYLAQSLLLNATVRFTKANQFGILGFGGDRHDGYKPQFEGSAAYLLNRNLAIGAEYRSKPDNLNIAHENNAWDAFIAWAPAKHVSVTVAYVDLGNIVIRDNQRGWYASLQVGF